MRVAFLIRWVVPIVGAGVAITALFWLYRDLDLDRLVVAVATADARWLWLLAATILAEQLVRGWKWRQILYDLKPISSGVSSARFSPAMGSASSSRSGSVRW